MAVREGNTVAEAQAEIDRLIAGKTLLTEFRDAVLERGDAPALHWRAAAGWRALSWRDYRDQVRRAAYGLKALGFKGRGGLGVILIRNRPEHVIADLALLFARGVPVSLYNTLAPDQVAYIAGHCQAEIAFVEDAGMLARFEAVRDQLPALRHLVLIEGEAPGAIGWPDLLARGELEAERDPAWFDAAVGEVQPNDLATLIYTSGTTGPPKGVMDSHRNVLWMAASGNSSLPPALPDDDRHLSYLPLAHAFERYSGHWNAIIRRTQVYFCPDVQKVFEFAAEVHPTVMIGSPRVWEKLQAGIQAGIAADPDGQRRAAIEGALGVGRRVAEYRMRGEQLPPPLEAAATQAAPVWHAIRARVGLDQCRLGVTGAAPISPSVISFFRSLDLPLVEGYGMTESTVGATINEIGSERLGSVGRPNWGLEMKVGPDGELLMRGGNVMQGYYRDPAGTAAAIEPDGWLHTGDVASIDEDGYVRIIDRKKELIITAGGKNISPANIESLLKRNPLIGQAAVIGDRRSYVTALIVLDADSARVWAAAHGLQDLPLAELAQSAALAEEIQRTVDSVNQLVSQAEQVRRFRLLPVEWTAESGELTPTLKLKRRVVAERYASDIDDLYAQPRV
ncbi:MAG TPA: long-chain fatty acid--CoA ligase [Chloroflexota bacterium]